MERIVDKVAVLACTALGVAVVAWSGAYVAAMLIAVLFSALAEVLPRRWARWLPCSYALACLVDPVLGTFLPLAVYDLARGSCRVLRFGWLLPAFVCVLRMEPLAAVVMLFGCVLAYALARRTAVSLREKEEARHLRDDLREGTLALEEKNAQLRERQDLEVRLATLAERGRIAREIHDNVGHLLTRAIMQTEALQVVHRDDERVRSELAQVGETLHEAMGTVRASVHDLHDDAFDLETQVRAAAEACALPVRVEFRADHVPAEVGYGFIAIVREALSNAVRHSNAGTVEVSVVEHPGFYRLVVHDDGTRPSAMGEDGRGIGLTTMEDRARALGGVFRVSFEKGCKVFASVPKGAGEERV